MRIFKGHHGFHPNGDFRAFHGVSNLGNLGYRAFHLTKRITITHMLSQYPIVQVIDLQGNLIDASIVHLTKNTFRVEFLNPQSGYVIWDRNVDTNTGFTAVTSQTIAHGLGLYPLVQVIDNGSNVLDCEIIHNDFGTFTLGFIDSQAGTVIYSGTSAVNGFAGTTAIDIVHNLKRRPLFQLIDVNGTVISGAVQHLDWNTIRANFINSQSGTAIYK